MLRIISMEQARQGHLYVWNTQYKLLSFSNLFLILLDIYLINAERSGLHCSTCPLCNLKIALPCGYNPTVCIGTVKQLSYLLWFQHICCELEPQCLASSKHHIFHLWTRNSDLKMSGFVFKRRANPPIHIVKGIENPPKMSRKIICMSGRLYNYFQWFFDPWVRAGEVAPFIQ